MGFGPEAGQLSEMLRTRWVSRYWVYPAGFYVPVNKGAIWLAHQRLTLRVLGIEFWPPGGPKPIGRIHGFISS